MTAPLRRAATSLARAGRSPAKSTRHWSLEDKVRSELELMGLTVSAHPLKLYEEELIRIVVRMSYELPSRELMS